MPRAISSSVSLMWRELPPAARPAAAKAAGFNGIEVQVIGECPPATLAAAAEAAGVPVVLLNLDLGDWLAGGPGVSGVPGREAVFAEAVEAGLDAALRLHPRFLHIGPSRVPDGVSRDACLATYRANLRHLLARRAARGVAAEVLIEPVNRHQSPSILIGDAAAAAAVIGDGFAGEVGILLDLFHAVTDGRDPLADHRRHAGLVRHVQFADVPGRGPPGAGSLDLAALFEGLEAQGYAGGYGAEYLPGGDTAASLAWLPGLRG